MCPTNGSEIGGVGGESGGNFVMYSQNAAKAARNKSSEIIVLCTLSVSHLDNTDFDRKALIKDAYVL